MRARLATGARGAALWLLVPLLAAAGWSPAAAAQSPASGSRGLQPSLSPLAGTATAAPVSLGSCAQPTASLASQRDRCPEGAAAGGPEPYMAEAGLAFMLSALVPGAGQWRLGVDRWVPYAALESWGWITYFNRRNQSRRLEREYRDVAWSVARRVSVPRDPRREGDWDYYESLGKWHSSGVFDSDPRTPIVQPERDESTYNGMIWGLARAIHLPPGATAAEDSFEYQQALLYYMQRAVPPELAWSWGDNGLERQVYLELVRERDEATRAATRALGLILANHLISAVDALIAGRLREISGSSVDLRLEGALTPDPDARRWLATLRLAWPRGP